MGNGCSIFNINKVCFDGDINIRVQKEEEHNKKEGKRINYNLIRKRSTNKSIRRQKSFNNNGKRNNNKLNLQTDYKPCISFASIPNNMAKPIIDNTKIENKIKSNKKMSSFTNLIQEYDIPAYGGGSSLDQNNVFDLNYILVDDNYNEEMIDYLNKIRSEPNNIIHDIDELLKQKQYINDNNDIDNIDNIDNINNDKIQIESEKTHENIVFNDGGQALEETKLFLISISRVTKQFNINDDLLIDIPDPEKNDLLMPLDKRITKIIMEKRKNIMWKYPNCQFFINFIKDEKIGLLFLLSQNENISNFRNIIFNEQYTEFNVTWMKEKRNIFIAFLCFA
jgi:hypothetical protein